MRFNPRSLRGSPLAASLDLAVAVFAGLLAAAFGAAGQAGWCAGFALLTVWNLYVGVDTFWWLHSTGYGRVRHQLIRHARDIGDGMWMADDGIRTTWTADRFRLFVFFRFRVIFEVPDQEAAVETILAGEQHVLWRAYIIPSGIANVYTETWPVEVTVDDDDHLTLSLSDREVWRERRQHIRMRRQLRRDVGAGVMTTTDLDGLNDRLATAYRHPGEA